MDFAFSTTPDRVAASMCRPLAWAALDLGHRVHALRSYSVEGSWRLEMEEPGAAPPADPFVYGHTGLVQAVASGAMPGWRVDYDPALYDREEWNRRLGDAMWNHEARICELSEALASWKSGRMHLCPAGADSGPKAFKGICAERSEIGFELARAARGRALDPRMRVALSHPDAPMAEYRCVFVGGAHAASGRYLLDGALAEEPGAPDSVAGFARDVADQWAPGAHFVVDVGVGRDGRMAVVEFNSLHSSGLYRIDRSLVASALAERWESSPATLRSAPKSKLC